MFSWIHLKVHLTSKKEEESWIEISQVEVVLYEERHKGNLATTLLSSGDFKEKFGAVSSLANGLNGEGYFETNFVAKEPNLAATIAFLQRVGFMVHGPNKVLVQGTTKPALRVTFKLFNSLRPHITVAWGAGRTPLDSPCCTTSSPGSWWNAKRSRSYIEFVRQWQTTATTLVESTARSLAKTAGSSQDVVQLLNALPKDLRSVVRNELGMRSKWLPMEFPPSHDFRHPIPLTTRRTDKGIVF